METIAKVSQGIVSSGILVSALFVCQPIYAQAVPQIEHGIQFGDLNQDSVMVWSRTDQPARMMIEYSTNESFQNANFIRGPYALEKNDFTSKQAITGLPPASDIYVRVWYESLHNDRLHSDPVIGHFETIDPDSNVRFVWGGDTAGQGFGINEAFGGMKIYETMRSVEPQFFIHSGDVIYADNPIPAQKVVEENQIWQNQVYYGVDKVAESLDEFRGRYKYNLTDLNVQAFNAEVPQIWQWDDHEVVNNWSDSKDLSSDDRYQVKDVPLLVSRAATAFHEYSPKKLTNVNGASRVYRKIDHGPLLDIFVLDMRSYRGPNTQNLQKSLGPDSTFLGKAQLTWLIESLEKSDAVWKVIASDMPIGLNISDDYVNNPPRRWEGIANNHDGAPLGRELELAKLFSQIKENSVKNVVWLTADVHYAAAHFYDPDKAAYQDFEGFWEFVAGPLNAGSFGPNSKDNTFGIQAVFEKAPASGQSNLSPFSNLQFFGQVDIDKSTRDMTVELKDLFGETVYTTTIPAQ